MEYIDVQWSHTNHEYPFRLVSELNDQRYEIRKLEFFSSGLVGYASEAKKTENTRLGTIPIPLLEEINADRQFHGVSIQKQSFETLWRQHAGPDA